MAMTQLSPMLRSWASILDPQTLQQGYVLSRLPILAGPVCLMPDAHLGIGATVGSVVVTRDAIAPGLVGVDIGCGVIWHRTSLQREDLPSDLTELHRLIASKVPSGVGRGHGSASTKAADEWFSRNPYPGKFKDDLGARAYEQFGTLGSGNHFVEVCLDEESFVSVMVHSGSRGVGNRLATEHLKVAKEVTRKRGDKLEDQDTAWLVDGTEEFASYLRDMIWCQDYAYGNREAMVNAALDAVREVVGRSFMVTKTVNCHHNFSSREDHGFGIVWVTRKGAINAAAGKLGVIPGSMGTLSYVTEGLGSSLSYSTSSHGAGRVLSRGAAKRSLSVEDLREMMSGKFWNDYEAEALLDEAPGAYKPIDQVMADQADLTRPVHALTQIVNYKGT